MGLTIHGLLRCIDVFWFSTVVWRLPRLHLLLLLLELSLYGGKTRSEQLGLLLDVGRCRIPRSIESILGTVIRLCLSGSVLATLVMV